jgi:hypothetical protein
VLGGQASFGVTALGNYASTGGGAARLQRRAGRPSVRGGFYWARSIGGNGWRTRTVLLLSGVLLVGIAIIFGG